MKRRQKNRLVISTFMFVQVEQKKVQDNHKKAF